jgi:hypothetical protein
MMAAVAGVCLSTSLLPPVVNCGMFMVFHFTYPDYRCSVLKGAVYNVTGDMSLISAPSDGYGAAPYEIAAYSFALYFVNIFFVGLFACLTFKCKRIGGASLQAEQVTDVGGKHAFSSSTPTRTSFGCCGRLLTRG